MKFKIIRLAIFTSLKTVYHNNNGTNLEIVQNIKFYNKFYSYKSLQL